MSAAVNYFLWGVLAMGSAVAGLFFWRFWRLAGDRLFVFFALAFGVFAANWTALALVQPSDETRHYYYVLRFLAFVLIIVGVVDKNRRARKAGG